MNPAIVAGADCPLWMLFQPMVVPTARAQIALAGRAKRMRDVVVDVDAGVAADGLGAATVPNQNVLSQRCRWIVDGCADVQQGAGEWVVDDALPASVGDQPQRDVGSGPYPLSFGGSALFPSSQSARS